MGEDEIAADPALVSATADEERLMQLGIELAAAAEAPADVLVELLEQVAECLHGMRFSGSVIIAIRPLLNATVRKEFLKHEDEYVKVRLSFCFCEITRITMPEVPWTDDVLRDIFYLIVGTFNGLSDVNSQSFGWIVAMMQTLERSRLCVVMLDVECQDLVIDMFQTFLKVAREDHEENILKPMQSIMVSIIDESDEVHESLLRVLLSALGWKKTGAAMSGRILARNVIEQAAGKLEPYINAFLTSWLTGNSSSDNDIDHHGIILDVYQCTPKTHDVVVPYIIGELLADGADVRSKAVELIGQLYSLPGPSIFEYLEPLFPLFLNRLTDNDTVIEVRVSVIRNLKKWLISNHSQPEALKIIKALCDILLDHDENVGKEVVTALCDVACHSVGAIPVDIMKIVAEHVHNTSMVFKWYTVKRMADIYKLYCMKDPYGSTNPDDFGWIPGKILNCLYGDFSLELLESILCDSLFPPEFPVKGRVKHWVLALAYFNEVEMKVLEQVFLQKKRLQQEMLKYMAVRNLSQADDPDVQKKVSECFRSISHLFSDPGKCEKNMNILHQLKDANVWKIFSALLDCSTTFKNAWSLRVDLLSILGETHALYDFVSALAMRCSYSLMNKEYAKYLVSEACEQKSAGNTKLISSCMDLLTAIASFFPSLLYGLEEDIIELLLDLKEDNAVHGDDVPGLESRKRHKPKSICSIGKCCAHDLSRTNLIGQRIEVWWPLDKRFYEGVVQSYDSSKRRHTVQSCQNLLYMLIISLLPAYPT